MTLSREEIVNLALRYITIDEITNFPQNRDLFVFLKRLLPENKVLKPDEGWKFSGYGVCLGYEVDVESKPEGKWLFFTFLSLDTFPPTKQTIKLQPPHIVRGIFQSSGRNAEIKIMFVSTATTEFSVDDKRQNEKKSKETSVKNPNNILTFPKKNS